MEREKEMGEEMAGERRVCVVGEGEIMRKRERCKKEMERKRETKKDTQIKRERGT